MSDSNVGTTPDRVGGLGGLLDIMFEQSLLVRAEQNQFGAVPERPKWQRVATRLAVRALTFPFRRPVPTVVGLVTLLFLPLF